MKKARLVRTGYWILALFLFSSVGLGQKGNKPGVGGGHGKTDNRPLNVVVYDYAEDGTPYRIQSDGNGFYQDGLDGTDASILGSSGNLTFRPAGTKNFDQAIRSLTFTFDPAELGPEALAAGLDDPLNLEPGAVVGVDNNGGIYNMALGDVLAARTNIRVATIDDWRYGLRLLGDPDLPGMSAIYKCLAVDSEGCTQWQVTGFQALLVRGWRGKRKDAVTTPEVLGTVTMPFELLATVQPGG